MIAVSLMIPCYNMEKYINRCLDSVLSQTFRDIQLIIVNDGSSDDSEALILQRKAELENALSAFVYVKQSNGGAAAACNTGLKYAAGKYLLLLDGDDTLEPDAVRLMSGFLDCNPDFALVRTNGWQVNEMTGERHLFLPDREDPKSSDIFTELLTGNAYNWAGSYMIRMKTIDEIYPDREIYLSRGGQNLQFVMAAAYKRKSGFINQPLMNYTIRQDSSSHFSAETAKKQLAAMKSYKDIREHVLEHVAAKDEIAEYQRILDSRYSKIYLALSTELKDTVLARQEYESLKRNKAVTLDDTISYCKAVHPSIAIFPVTLQKVFRVIRRLSDKMQKVQSAR